MAEIVMFWLKSRGMTVVSCTSRSPHSAGYHQYYHSRRDLCASHGSESDEALIPTRGNLSLLKLRTLQNLNTHLINRSHHAPSSQITFPRNHTSRWLCSITSSERLPRSKNVRYMAITQRKHGISEARTSRDYGSQK